MVGYIFSPTVLIEKGRVGTRQRDRTSGAWQVCAGGRGRWDGEEEGGEEECDPVLVNKHSCDVEEKEDVSPPLWLSCACDQCWNAALSHLYRRSRAVCHRAVNDCLLATPLKNHCAYIESTCIMLPKLSSSLDSYRTCHKCSLADFRIPSGRIDLDKPRYDQSTYWGRAKHYFEVTDPRTILASNDGTPLPATKCSILPLTDCLPVSPFPWLYCPIHHALLLSSLSQTSLLTYKVQSLTCLISELDAAKNLLELYRANKEPAGTTEEQVWHAKKLYDSAFHPQTGEKNFFVGRMSCQVPGNMLITGAMMVWYRSNPAQILLQWANQSFNAVVNYTNRNASSNITNEMLAQAYFLATGSSCVVAVGLNKMIAKSPTLSKGIIGRFVPLIAVASANCVNIPLMRQVELKEGIMVADAEGKELGKSKNAAVAAVGQVGARIFPPSPSPCLSLPRAFDTQTSHAVCR
eukprot:692844-Hanusia_phi.AAC.8